MRVSVPSWVIPGTYAENLRFLREKTVVTGVELLFFLYDEETRKLFQREKTEIAQHRDRFTYTIHLPDVVRPEHEELVASTADLVASWVVHPGPPEKASGTADMLLTWRKRYGDCFFLENTQGGRLENLRDRLPDFPLCMDTGHLLLEGRSPAAYAAQNRHLIREVHLHGLGAHGDGLRLAERDGRLPDHRPFASDAAWFVELTPFLADFGGVTVAEVFSWTEAAAILGCIDGIHS